MAGKSAVVRVAIVGDNSSLNRSLKSSQSGLSKFGKAVAKAGILAGAAAGVALLKMAEAAAKDEQAAAVLASTLKSVTGATDKQIGATEDWITQQGKLLGITDDQLRPALGKLVAATGDVAESQELAGLAWDASIALGKDYESVVSAVAKAEAGSVGGLSKLGIATKDTSGKTKELSAIYAEMAQKFGGAGAAAADTAAGKFNILKIQISELGESIGSKLLPVLTDIADWFISEGEPALERFAQAASAKLGPVLQDLREWFVENKDELASFAGIVADTALPVLETLGHVVGTLVGWFSKLPGPIKVAAAAAGLAYLAFRKLSPMVTTAGASMRSSGAKIRQFGAELTYSTSATKRFVGSGINKLPAIGRAAGGIVGTAVAVGMMADSIGRIKTENLDRALTALSHGDQTADIDTIIHDLESLTSWDQQIDLGEIVTLGGLAGDTTLDKQKQNLDALDQSLAQMVESGNAAEAAVLLAKINEAAAGEGVSKDEVLGFLTQYQTAVKNAGDAAADGVGPLSDYAGATAQSAEAAQEEADAITEAVDAMKAKRSETLRALDAELGYQAAIDDAAAALKANGKTVDKSTEKGRDNLTNLYALADAWNQQGDAAKNATGSLKTAKDGFVKTATAMGMPIEKAENLAKRLFEIPSKRRTDITLEGVDNATNKAEGLKAILDKLKSKDIYIALHYQTLGNKPKGPLPGDPNSRKQGEDAGVGFLAGMLDAFTKGGDKIAEALETIAKMVQAELDKQLKKQQQAIKKRLDGKAETKKLKELAKAWQEHSNAVTKALKSHYAALRANGKAQDENAAKLNDAATAVANYADAIKESFVSFGDIAQLGKTATGKTTLPKLLADLRKRVDDARKFAELMQQLSGWGLDPAQIAQLTAAGPEAALATAQAIASGGEAAVKEINDLSRDLALTGGALGTALADVYSITGVKSALAYVKQLEDEQTRLDNAAIKMAKAFSRKIEELLGLGKKGGGQGGGGQGGGGQGGQGGGGNGNGNSGHKRDLYDLPGEGRPQVTVKLTAQQVSSLERGREIQLDLDTYRNAGGRARA